MDQWVRSLFGGLMLVAVAIGAVVLLKNYEGQLAPYINYYIDVDYTAFIFMCVMVFLVGFAMTSKRQADEIQDFMSHPGRIFTGPNTRVKPSSEPNEVEEIELVQEAHISYLQDRISKLDENQAIILKVKLHPPAKMDFHLFGRTIVPLQRDIILYYLEHLKKFPNFKYVVFVDWFNRFLFFSKANALRKEIEPIDGTHLIDLMNGNRVKELSDLNIFNPHALTNHTSNLKALRFMARNDISEVMITSHTWGRRMLGVAELNGVLSLLLAPKKKKKEPKPKKKPSAQPLYDDGREDPILIEEEELPDTHDVVTDDRRHTPSFDSEFEHKFDDMR